MEFKVLCHFPFFKWKITSKTLLTMKLSAMILLFACMQVSARSYSQGITIMKKDAPVETVIQEIKRQTGYNFIYTVQLMKETKKVSIDVKNASLQQVLELCLAGQPVTYQIMNRTVILRLVAPGRSPVAAAYMAAPLTVHGFALDEDGKPVAGVSVTVKGSQQGTVTNQTGQFLIKVQDPRTVLVFTSVSTETLEVPVNGRTELQVTLKKKASKLDQTVVIAYGSTTRRLVTGSVSSLTAEEMSKETITNPLTALQGHIAGVQITQDNGLAGGGVRVQIRGQNSAAAGFIPLYVVDGVPFTLFNGGQPFSDALNSYGTSGANGSISPFSMINPEDIERIDVLKDADATAIYGSRGANGVVLITTKKGGKGRTAVNVNLYQGISKVNHFIDMMNTPEYLAMRKEAFANSNVTPTASNAKDLTVWDQNAYTDWQRWAMGGTAHSTHASATLTGGNAQNSFLFNSTYHREGTVFPGSYATNSFSGRLSAGHTSLDNRFSINASANYAYMGNNLPTVDISSLYNLPPNYQLYTSAGALNWDLTNPLGTLMQGYNAQTTNLLTNVNLAYKVLPGLSLKANLGYTLTSLHQTKTTPARSINSTNTADNKLVYADNNNGNYIVEPQAEYLRSISKGRLQLLGGATFQQNKSTGIYLTGSNYASEALLNSVTSAGTVVANYNNYSLYKYSAVFGRLNYNWQNKYILDGTFRRDGSSRFGPGHRFGNFGAVGAAWLFTQEQFMNSVKWLSSGKLRASYGVTGNDQVANYQYWALYSTASSSYSYLGTSVLVPGTIANPDLHWESTKKLDLALELGLLEDRIFIKADYYRNRSSDQLVYIAEPTQTGVSSYTGNFPALIQNKGWEFELSLTPLRGGAVKWQVSANLTINRNKLISFPGLATSSYANSYIIGKPIDVVQLYHYTGVNKQTGAPTFQDRNGDNVISYANDRIPMSIGFPYYGGISNTITYKGLSLDFTFQFNHRMGYVNNTLSTNYNPYGYGYTNQSKALLNRWSAANQNGFYPAAGVVYSAAYSTLASSDYNWGDASFIKFKTLSLTYTASGKWLRAAHISSASVYARGQNLFTWAKQKYTLDPETTQPGTGSGLGTGTYIAFPQLRTMVLGLNLSF